MRQDDLCNVLNKKLKRFTVTVRLSKLKNNLFPCNSIFFSVIISKLVTSMEKLFLYYFNMKLLDKMMKISGD